ncbi:MAG: DUF1287 domain-containing protein [Clostridia bacterium]|nr:DUF1287 domain-containing protein [Clostridia bacterium]
MNKKTIKVLIISVLISIPITILLYKLNIIPHKQYNNSNFNIETYISNVDKDNDGIDDQTDILNNVKKYIETKPKYKSQYYSSGYSNDEYGVCTDVVAFGLKDAGYDLMELVNKDIINSKENYNIEVIDKNIDFRRVRNLDLYFKNNHISLTTDLSKIEEWQGGDIIVFKDHIGVISDKRNKRGVPFLIHHANPMQVNYEEDILELYEKGYIIGHYRIS